MLLFRFSILCVDSQNLQPLTKSFDDKRPTKEEPADPDHRDLTDSKRKATEDNDTKAAKGAQPWIKGLQGEWLAALRAVQNTAHAMPPPDQLARWTIWSSVSHPLPNGHAVQPHVVTARQRHNNQSPLNTPRVALQLQLLVRPPYF